MFTVVGHDKHILAESCVAQAGLLVHQPAWLVLYATAVFVPAAVVHSPLCTGRDSSLSFIRIIF